MAVAQSGADPIRGARTALRLRCSFWLCSALCSARCSWRARVTWCCREAGWLQIRRPLPPSLTSARCRPPPRHPRFGSRWCRGFGSSRARSGARLLADYDSCFWAEERRWFRVASLESAHTHYSKSARYNNKKKKTKKTTKKKTKEKNKEKEKKKEKKTSKRKCRRLKKLGRWPQQKCSL